MVRYTPFKDMNEAGLVYGCKELPYIALQYPDCARVIVRYLIRKAAEMVESFMRPFPFSTRIRTGNEGLIKKWVENAVQRMMKKTVEHARFMYATRLWIGDAKCLVCRMNVGFFA